MQGAPEAIEPTDPPTTRISSNSDTSGAYTQERPPSMPMSPLYLYEQILLLSLCNRKGTLAGAFPDYAIAGAALAELLLEGRVGHLRDEPTKLAVLDRTPMGDPVLDACFERILESDKHRTLKEWVARLVGVKGLRALAADQLIARGIVRSDQDKVLLFFKRQVYPEINPEPEAALIEELRGILFHDVDEVSERMATLIGLAHASGLLAIHFGAKEIRAREEHIKAITAGDLLQSATQQAISALTAAIFLSTMIPVIVSS